MQKKVTTHHEYLGRISRIEGQVKAVGRMVDESAYCIDIITQIQAARAALQSVSNLILEKHIRLCVADTMSDKADVSQKIDEIMTSIKRLSK
jgi:DNA-binding FrmR family transcriptional regulator